MAHGTALRLASLAHGRYSAQCSMVNAQIRALNRIG
jgi:hypothetical protein